jgi:DNA repair protein RecO
MTREHGMVRVLAKGSKRERSAFSGGLEICTLGSMNAIVRPSSELALLTVWDLEEPMLRIRSDLNAYRSAMMAVDLVPRMVQDHDPHTQVFDALLKFLRLCDSGERDQQSVIAGLAWYQWAVLVSIGSMPIFDHDVLTGEELGAAYVFGFSAEFGGVTQDPITQGAQSHPATRMVTDQVWRIRWQTVEFFRSLGPDPDIDRFLGEPMDQILRSARLLAAFIQERTGSEIPSMRWLLDN